MSKHKREDYKKLVENKYVKIALDEYLDKKIK